MSSKVIDLELKHPDEEYFARRVLQEEPDEPDDPPFTPDKDLEDIEKLYVETKMYMGSNYQPMKALLDMSTSDIYVATTKCTACPYTYKYDMKSSKSASFKDKDGPTEVKSLDIYYPRKMTYYFNGTYIYD